MTTFFLYDFIPYWLSFNPPCLLLELLLLLLSNFQFFFKVIDVTSMYFRTFKDLYSSDALHHIYTTIWRWCVCVCVCVCARAQLCPTHCDPMGCSPPGSSVYGIFQVKILEQVAISCSKESSWPWDWTWVSCIGRWVLCHWTTKEAYLSPYSYRYIDTDESSYE